MVDNVVGVLVDNVININMVMRLIVRAFRPVCLYVLVDNVVGVLVDKAVCKTADKTGITAV